MLVQLECPFCHAETFGEDAHNCQRLDRLRQSLRARRPYSPPAVEESGSFERLTLACSHVPMGPDNCHPASVRS
jgi:hypothetical protein